MQFKKQHDKQMGFTYTEKPTRCQLLKMTESFSESLDQNLGRIHRYDLETIEKYFFHFFPICESDSWTKIILQELKYHPVKTGAFPDLILKVTGQLPTLQRFTESDFLER